MNKIQDNIQLQYLKIIKEIIRRNDLDLIILNRPKNKAFIKKHELTKEDIVEIILDLSLKDVLAGPEFDNDPDYDGWVFMFCPIFREEKLYIKIRVENRKKAICISIHEFGLYKGDD